MKHAEKKGATAKFLAMIASFTMILAGVAGVALAGPASADNPTNGAASNSPSDVCDALLGSGNWTWVDRFDQNSNGSGTHVTVSGLPNDSGTWTSVGGAYVAAAQVHAGNTGGSFTGVPGSVGGNWSTNGQTISTLTFCGGTKPEPVDLCKDIDGVQETYPYPNSCTKPEPVDLCKDIDGVQETYPYPNSCTKPEPVDLCKDIDGVQETYPYPNSCTKPEDPKFWICHWTDAEKYVVIETDDSGWTSGHADHPKDKKLVWTGEGKPEAKDCTDVVDTDVCPDIEGNQATYPYDGTCTAPTNPPVDPQNPGSSDPAPAVVEPVAVVAPEAASVPEAVAAPAPATVAAPASVIVPQAATLPAAVPAGDGSQAPGVPMWAIALMAFGLLGAAFSAKGLLADRK